MFFLFTFFFFFFLLNFYFFIYLTIYYYEDIKRNQFLKQKINNGNNRKRNSILFRRNLEFLVYIHQKGNRQLLYVNLCNNLCILGWCKLSLPSFHKTCTRFIWSFREFRIHFKMQGEKSWSALGSACVGKILISVKWSVIKLRCSFKIEQGCEKVAFGKKNWPRLE